MAVLDSEDDVGGNRRHLFIGFRIDRGFKEHEVARLGELVSKVGGSFDPRHENEQA